jgi:hypothetical protein
MAYPISSDTGLNWARLGLSAEEIGILLVAVPAVQRDGVINQRDLSKFLGLRREKVIAAFQHAAEIKVLTKERRRNKWGGNDTCFYNFDSGPPSVPAPGPLSGPSPVQMVDQGAVDDHPEPEAITTANSHDSWGYDDPGSPSGPPPGPPSGPQGRVLVTESIDSKNPTPQGRGLQGSAEKQPIPVDFQPTAETRAKATELRPDIPFEAYWPWWVIEARAQGREYDDFQAALLNWIKNERHEGKFNREQRAKNATSTASPRRSAGRRGPSVARYDLAENIAQARGVLAQLREGRQRPGDSPPADQPAIGLPATRGG